MTLEKIFAFAMLVLGLIFVPWTILESKNEKLIQSNIETITVEFVDNCRADGVISPDAYEEMYRKVCQLMDAPSITLSHSSRVEGYDGSDVYEYYVDFNNQEILDVMYDSDPNENINYKMRNGDYLTVTVYNTQPTMATKLRRVFTRQSGKSNLSIYYTYGGTVGNYSEER